MDLITELQQMLDTRMREAEILRSAIAQLSAPKGSKPDEKNTNPSTPLIHVYETPYPFTEEPAVFKGKKPTAIMFSDGTMVNVSTWKGIAQAVLQRCNQDVRCHDLLMELRDRVAGRNRYLLSSSGEGMRSPLKIDEDLYMETHYSAETLLYTLKTRILDAVGYDYRGISVCVRK